MGIGCLVWYRSNPNGDDDTGVSGVPASDGSTADAGTRDGDAETIGAAETGTAHACHAIHLPTGIIYCLIYYMAYILRKLKTIL